MSSDDAKMLFDFLAAPDAYKAVEALFRPKVEALLRHEADKFGQRPHLVYRGPGDFLLQHGKWFTRVAVLPPEHHWPRGLCYGSALNAAVWYGEKYYEGIALCLPQVVTWHAWNIQPEHPDVVIDRTFHDTPGLVYCGVEFSVERVDDCTWNGDASVLNDSRRNYPLFQQRWNGEDYSIKWPYSERIELLKAKDRVRGAAWVQEQMKALGLTDEDMKRKARGE
jgi:hypothetical protein